ncbi:MAG: hypothetical protein IPP35_05370 [Elusimicrobia bacterium]|nr:hypothetical protein [Elusimicrobiota bacterium]
MNILDDAFCLVRDHTIEIAQELLSKQRKDCGKAEIEYAIGKAKALIDYAEHCAEMVRQKKLEEPEALKEIKRAHPGFTLETYGFALNNGFFLTR